MSDLPHIRWTAIAGILFTYNVLAKRNGWEYATDKFRRHPACTIAFLTALAYHLSPRRLCEAQSVRSR